MRWCAVRWCGAVLLVVSLAACASDRDDRGSSSTTEAVAPACAPIESTAPSTTAPSTTAGDAVGGEVSLVIVGDPTFVIGDASPTLFAGGHDHAAGPVEAGQAHVHECLVIVNAGSVDLVVQAIQILPAEGEEAYALYEADVLAAEFGARSPEADFVAAGESVALELLAPVDPDAPPDAVRHRVAYTVFGPDGRRDLFVEGEVVAVDR